MKSGLSNFTFAPISAGFGTRNGLHFQQFLSVFQETVNYILLHISTDLEVNYEIVAVRILSLFPTLCVKAAVMAEWPKALATLFKDTSAFVCLAYMYLCVPCILEEGRGSPRTGVIEDCWAAMWVPESEPRSLKH